MISLSLVLICGLTVAYLTAVLVLEEKSSHYGPFPSATERVVWYRNEGDEQFSEYSYPVTIFDRIRRLYGLFSIAAMEPPPVEEAEACCPANLVFPDQPAQSAELAVTPISAVKSNWFIHNERVEVWTCPKCLSFWVSLHVATVVWLAGFGFEQAVACLFASPAIAMILIYGWAALNSVEYLAYSTPRVTYAIAQSSNSDEDDNTLEL